MQPNFSPSPGRPSGHPLSFGIWVPVATTWRNARDRLKLVEELGYDSLWVVDHFANPFETVFPWFEAWTTLAAIAAITDRIRLGTLVTNIIYRNPALIAKQTMTVDHISGGRLTLGIGAGSPDDLSHPMTGVEPWPNPERVERLREILEMLDLMLCNPVSTFEGKYYRVTDAVMLPGSLQKPRPPLLVGAHGRRMLELAATHADSWNTLVGPRFSAREALDATRRANDTVTECVAKAGRDPASIVRSICVGWTPDPSFDSTDSLVEFIGRYSEVGISEFIFGYWTEDDPPSKAPLSHISDDRMLERIAVDVLPKLKAA